MLDFNLTSRGLVPKFVMPCLSVIVLLRDWTGGHFGDEFSNSSSILDTHRFFLGYKVKLLVKT